MKSKFYRLGWTWALDYKQGSFPHYSYKRKNYEETEKVNRKVCAPLVLVHADRWAVIEWRESWALQLCGRKTAKLALINTPPTWENKWAWTPKPLSSQMRIYTTRRGRLWTKLSHPSQLNPLSRMKATKTVVSQWYFGTEPIQKLLMWMDSKKSERFLRLWQLAA